MSSGPTRGTAVIAGKVRAAGLNPLDWHSMRGEPYLMRLSSGFGAPDDPSFGVDYAGTVEAVGSEAEAVANVRRSAYTRADIDTIKTIRRYAHEGLLHDA